MPHNMAQHASQQGHKHTTFDISGLSTLSKRDSSFTARTDGTTLYLCQLSSLERRGLQDLQVLPKQGLLTVGAQ